MTTVVEPSTIRALLSGRLHLPRAGITYRLQNVASITTGATYINALFPPRAYIHEDFTAYTITSARFMLTSGLLFNGVNLTEATTYYIVAVAQLADPIQAATYTARLWYSSFVASETITNEYFLFSYPDNIVFEV